MFPTADAAEKARADTGDSSRVGMYDPAEQCQYAVAGGQFTLWKSSNVKVDDGELEALRLASMEKARALCLPVDG